MVSILMFLLLSISPIHAQSEIPAVAFGFAQTNHGPFTFRQVELISRFHAIGMWRGGDATLNPWIEISENAFLGVDQFGRLLNVIRLKDRTVAYVLSGDRKIRDIFYLAPGILLALDTSGELLLYNPAEWSRHNLKDFILRAGRNVGISQCLATTGLAAFSRIADVSIVAPEILAGFGLAAVTGVMIQAFSASAKFESQNQITDGFEALGVQLSKFRYPDLVRGADGSIIDYVHSGQSLMAAIARSNLREPVNFDKTCEHELLPRGIPPRTYEPTF